MKKLSLYALCMSAALLCLPLVSCGDDDKEELTENLGGGSGNGGNDDENANGENSIDDGSDDGTGGNNDGTDGDGGDTSTDVMVCEAVDLGLSVKWATCNVGASSPEKYGGYYAWGETEEKSYYDWSTYKYYESSSGALTKYCTDAGYGTVDNKTVLEPNDDVAHVKWGGSWRMPTSSEISELRNNCSWTWTTQNNVNGYVVTSKVNGNSIFLPAAGYRWSEEGDFSGSIGYYWSASLGGYDYSYSAYSLVFISGDWGLCSYTRGIGFSVRPVTD